MAFVTVRVDEASDGYSSNIWVIDLGGNPLLFTQGKHDNSPRWSPDGRSLLFLARADVLYASFSNRGDRIAFVARTNDLDPRIGDIFLLSEGGEYVKQTDSDMSIGPISWSPDDNRILFRGNKLPRGGASHATVWCLSLIDRKVEDLTRAFDRQSNRSIYYDVQGPYAVDPQPVWVGDHIYFSLQEGGRFNLYRRTLEEARPEDVIVGDFILTAFSVVGENIAYTRVEDTKPAELYLLEEGREKRLTRFNDDLLKEVRLVKPENFTFKASDGTAIDAWMLKPHSFRKERRYPLVLNIHGGPKSAWGYSFMFENQLLAAKGYAVLYVNSRGSGGYTEEFADIRKHYGERDFLDLMEAVDYTLKNKPFIDPKRLGVTGISYGGFMTNWVVGHTDRFKAAVSLEGISSWFAMYGTTDIGFYFSLDQIGGRPWSNAEGYLEKSPLTYVEKVKTPIMFIHSIEDYRCWIDQALSFYTALKALGKETELILFMKGAHTFGWSGKPSHRIKKLEHTHRWFDKHLK